MPKQNPKRIPIYIPNKKMQEHPVEHLIKLGKRRDRSLKYLAVGTVLEYVGREENK